MFQFMNNSSPPPQTGDPSSRGVTSEGAPEPHLVIWGTDVNVQETRQHFKQFLEQFANDLPGDGGDSPVAEDRAVPYYLQRLDEVGRRERRREEEEEEVGGVGGVGGG